MTVKLNKKPSVGLIILSSIGILASLFVGFVFCDPQSSHEPAYIAVIYLALNIGLLLYKNWARIIMLILSLFFVCLFVIGLFFAGQSAIGMLFVSPIILYALLAIIYLMLPEVRKRFKQS